MGDHFPLDKARRIRDARALALEKLGEGRVKPADLLRRPPGVLKGAAIWDTLLAFPGIGEVSARDCLEKAHVWPLATIAELSPRQINRIIEYLPERTNK